MSLYKSITMAVGQLDNTSPSEVYASRDMATLITKYADTPEKLEAVLRIALSAAYRKGAMDAAELLTGRIQELGRDISDNYQMLNVLDESVFGKE